MTKTMKAPIAGEVDELAAKYLKKKAQYDALGTELSELKERIVKGVDAHGVPFSSGELMLTTALLKEVLNPPKILKNNGSTLDAGERALLAQVLDPKYVVNDVNVRLLLEWQERDKKLVKTLAAQQVRIEQSMRVDIRRRK